MLGVFGYLSVEATQQSRNVVVVERVRLTKNVATHVDEVIKYSKAELRHIAELEDIRRHSTNLEAARLVLRYFAHDLGTFDTLTLVSPEGRVLLTEPPDAGIQQQDGSKMALIDRALTSGDTVVAPVSTFLPDHPPVAGLASLVTNEAGAEVAVLMAELHPSHTGLNLLFVGDLGTNARAELIDGDGNFLAVSAGGHVTGQTENRDLLSQLIARREPGVRIRDANEPGGNPTIVAYAPMETLPWGIVVEQNQDAVLALPQLLERMVVVMGLLSLLVVLTAAWMAMRWLVRPINQLTAEAERIAGGGLTTPIFSDRGDELGRLARTLDSMRIRLRALLEDAQQLDRMKSEFVARASHELRTPLASIKSLAETLMREDLDIDRSEERDYLSSIDGACDRLARIIDGLLTVSRIEAGGVEMHIEVVCAQEIVTRVVEQFHLGSSGHSFVVEVPPDLPRVMADPDRLEDILSNLISNATKYSPPDGRVTVGARPVIASHLAAEVLPNSDAGEMVEMWVADQGIGISRAEQSRLFQRFFRADNPVTRRASGVGLGLYIIKAYVESMGGAIWVDSKPSCGSTFRFTLPVAPSSVRVIPAAPVEADVIERQPVTVAKGDRCAEKNARVLVVDDELDVLRATARNLRANGYEVLVATAGEDAIDLLGRRKLDIAIVDIALPGIGGLDIAQWIRGNPDTAELPLVFITAKAQEEDELRGWKAGGDGYIKKPFSQGTVLQMVEDILSVGVEQRKSRSEAAIRRIETQIQIRNRRRS